MTERDIREWLRLHDEDADEEYPLTCADCGTTWEAHWYGEACPHCELEAKNDAGC